jgi:hypothetical protein
MPLLQLEVSRVAVMTVGDQRGTRRQVLGYRGVVSRISDGPQPVAQAIGRNGFR